MKTFENAPESLEFWEEIKREFDPIQTYLCSLPVFEGAWQTLAHHDSLRKLATDFLKEVGNNRFAVGKVFLFILSPSSGVGDISFYERGSIRSEFINWNIQRLSNK